MSVQFDSGRVKKTKPRAYLVRFVFGGTVAAVSGLLTIKFGAAVGALFLAFPAILPASLTLVKTHDGEEAAGDDALGAVAGSLGLIAFGSLGILVGPTVLAGGADALETATTAITMSEITDCDIMSSLARRERTSVSVGLKAVLVLNAKKR